MLTAVRVVAKILAALNRKALVVAVVVVSSLQRAELKRFWPELTEQRIPMVY